MSEVRANIGNIAHLPATVKAYTLVYIGLAWECWCETHKNVNWTSLTESALIHFGVRIRYPVSLDSSKQGLETDRCRCGFP